MDDKEKDEIIKKQHQVSLIKFSRIPEYTRNTHRFEKFIVTQDNEEAFNEALYYIPIHADGSEYTAAEFDNWQSYDFLTFYGPPGRGKTHLALAIGWHFILVGELRVVYFRTEDLLDELRLSYSQDNDKWIEIGKIVKNCEILILDDIGAQKNSEWARAKLDNIIDERYINNMRTVFTTNSGPADLGDRISSRIQEGVIVTVGGEDYRKLKAQRRAYVRANHEHS